MSYPTTRTPPMGSDPRGFVMTCKDRKGVSRNSLFLQLDDEKKGEDIKDDKD